MVATLICPPHSALKWPYCGSPRGRILPSSQASDAFHCQLAGPSARPYKTRPPLALSFLSDSLCDARDCGVLRAAIFSTFQVHNVRAKLVEILREKFAHLNLTFSIGGQISFDVRLNTTSPALIFPLPAPCICSPTLSLAIFATEILIDQILVPS
jgi:hypothetical protein